MILGGSILHGTYLWSQSLSRWYNGILNSYFIESYLDTFYSEIDYCCLNSTYLEVKGGGCFDTWSDVARYRDTCIWTEWTHHTCNMEMMTVSRLCRVTNMDCVIREFYLRLCNKDVILPLCSDSNNICNNEWLKNKSWYQCK